MSFEENLYIGQKNGNIITSYESNQYYAVHS